MAGPMIVPQRPRSFAGPVVLIILGVIFLLGNLHAVAWSRLGLLFARYWPVLLIVWGVIRLAEHYQAQRAGVRAPCLGVGGFFLLLLLIIFGMGATQSTQVNWGAVQDEVGMGDNWSLFGSTFNFSDQLQQPFPAGTSLRVVSDHGSVVVRAWDQNSIKVQVRKKISAGNEDEARKMDAATKPTIALENAMMTLNANTAGHSPPGSGGSFSGDLAVESDLEIYIPGNAGVELAIRHGDITVRQRQGPVKASTAHGDLTIEDLDGNANLNIRRGSLQLTRIHGDVTLDGRVEDTTVADLTGRLTMSGDFFGTMNLARISNGVSFKSSRTEMEFAKLNGDLMMESDELRAKSLSGPLRLLTKSKDIHLEGFSGDVRLENSNGSVELHASTLPLGNMQIDNRKGDVQLTVPPQAEFRLDARAQNGDIETDFSQLTVDNSHDVGRASGSVGSGGPHLEINSDHGTIEIRKAG